MNNSHELATRIHYLRAAMNCSRNLKISLARGGTIDDAHHVTGSKSSTRLSTAVALVAWIREPRQLTDDLSNQRGATEWIHVFQPNTRSPANEGALRCCCQPICAQFAYLCTIYAHLALPELRAGAETRQVQPPLTAG